MIRELYASVLLVLAGLAIATAPPISEAQAAGGCTKMQCTVQERCAKLWGDWACACCQASCFVEPCKTVRATVCEPSEPRPESCR